MPSKTQRVGVPATSPSRRLFADLKTSAPRIRTRPASSTPLAKGSPLPIRLAAPKNARVPRRRVTVDPRCLTSRRRRVSNTAGDGEASPSGCAIVLGLFRKTGGALNTGGEARLPGLIQTTSSSDENDDKANAGRGGGFRNKSVNAGTVFASAHRAMLSVHTKCLSLGARLILKATSSKDIGPTILPLSP
jgi:hypothetical protein